MEALGLLEAVLEILVVHGDNDEAALRAYDALKHVPDGRGVALRVPTQRGDGDVLVLVQADPLHLLRLDDAGLQLRTQALAMDDGELAPAKVLPAVVYMYTEGGDFVT